ncbi:MAG: hypothetical protein US86_C0001G0270 [Candidatus Daviesbacteria bacterium GW2011_GWA2_38_24]|uniref:Rossmann fold nucleotide-binding protein n=1 Tax=Candidatus Daviesbacteria bacterium GW2011_GWA2_38_24 TaxID=1618422 RepID=A0A0G0JI20_9BACT|nr:MAG: hypothetical protein US86_C0001G0270 [Candidatus Daviesbacteria bacterium GW2011_GWA2_38_24]KKQ77919.1 MAG: hypothetical protein UT01_C0080G0003 [Candidatus Daviesbacteria bacterium GW2011_GWA1_38_7]
MQIWKNFGKLLVSEDKEIDKARTIQNIAVFGFADAKENGPLYKEVFAVTKALAKAGYTIIDGGGPGVMRAATLGAKSEGGQVIGVTLYPKDMSHFEGRDTLNTFDEEVRTENYVERTLTLLREGQVYIVFNGGTGTVSEFAMAWGMARLYFGHHKPLILYGNFWKKIIKVFKENMKIRPEELKVYKVASSPSQVLKYIKDFEQEIEEGRLKDTKAVKSDFTIT